MTAFDPNDASRSGKNIHFTLISNRMIHFLNEFETNYRNYQNTCIKCKRLWKLRKTNWISPSCVFVFSLLFSSKEDRRLLIAHNSGHLRCLINGTHSLHRYRSKWVNLEFQHSKGIDVFIISNSIHSIAFISFLHTFQYRRIFMSYIFKMCLSPLRSSFARCLQSMSILSRFPRKMTASNA